MPRWLLWLLSLTVLVLIASWVVASFAAVIGHPFTWNSSYGLGRDLIDWLLPTCVVVSIGFFHGWPALGVRGSVAANVRLSLGFSACIVGLCLLLVLPLTAMPTYVPLPDSPWISGAPTNPSGLADVLSAAYAEEIFLLALMFFLLDRVPWRIRGRPFLMTGWATALIVAVRASYHPHLGVGLIALLLFGWLSVRLYRQTRMIVPVIAAHAAWSIPGLLPFTTASVTRALLVSVLAIAYVFLTRGPDDGSLIGFAGLPKSIVGQPENPGYFWARWRWDPVTTPPPPIVPAASPVAHPQGT